MTYLISEDEVTAATLLPEKRSSSSPSLRRWLRLLALDEELVTLKDKGEMLFNRELIVDNTPSHHAHHHIMHTYTIGPSYIAFRVLRSSLGSSLSVAT